MMYLIKKIILISLVSFTFMSCGEQTTTEAQTSTYPSPGVGTYDADFMNVTLSIPNPTVLGGAKSITYNSKSYLIGSGTTSEVSNRINSFGPGTFTIGVKATFATETGRYPNPTATFDVINISQIR